MSSIDIEEGDLRFTFAAGWEAQKYDDWVFYKSQFQKVCHLCNGIKGVDIVAHNDGTAWLVEVKDYRRNPRSKKVGLVDEVAKKVFDTLAGLVAAKNRANDASEKAMASAILACRNIRVVLHLEQASRGSKLFPKIYDPADLKKGLKIQLKAIDPHPEVLDKATTNPTTHWRVV
jgi:Holliday junction resolvase-like predicted endonuclease